MTTNTPAPANCERAIIMRASSTFRALALAAVVLAAAADNHGQLSQPSLKTQDGHVLLSSGGVVSNLTDAVSATKVTSVSHAFACHANSTVPVFFATAAQLLSTALTL